MHFGREICIAAIAAATIAGRTPAASAQPAPSDHLSALTCGVPLWDSGVIMPSVSPAGDTIAVSYQGEIWRIPSSGGTMPRLTAEEGFDLYPTWSPDGERIAYVKSRDFGSGPLRVIRADDGTAEKIAESPPVRGQPFFDRDGRRILGAFMAADGKSHQLAWFDVASGKLGESVYPLQMRQKFADRIPQHSTWGRRPSRRGGRALRR